MPEKSNPQEVKATITVADSSADKRTAGAVYRPLHVEREVKIYPIQEHELRTMGVLNTNVTICCSIASSAFVFMLSVIWDMLNAPPESPMKVGAVTILICLLVMAVTIAGAVCFQKTKQSELAKILSETK